MRLTAVGSCLLAAIVACTRPAKTPEVSPTPAPSWQNPATARSGLDGFASAEGASCRLAGRLRLDTELYLGPEDIEQVADLQGADVAVEILALAPRGGSRSRVRIRSAPTGPALVIDGWLENYVLWMRLARRVEVVPGHVWLERGDDVEVLAGSAERIRVRSLAYHCYADFQVTADTDCSALVWEEHGAGRYLMPPAPAALTARTLVQPKRTPLVLAGDDKKPLLELGAGLFELVRRAGRWSRVRHPGGPSIEGWVATSELEQASEVDRDDCGGDFPDRADRCPDDPEDRDAFEDNDGCPDGGFESIVAPQDVPLRLKRSLDAKIVAIVEKGTKIHVPHESDRFLSVDLEDVPITGPNGGYFWALESDVR